MEEIIDYLNTPLTIDELSSVSGIKIEELEDILKDLKKNGYIVKENGKYVNIKYYNMVRGIIQIKEKGYGFLKADNEVEYYVDKDNINDSMNGDLVLARVYKGYDGNLDEAVIIRIIKRNTVFVVGTISKRSVKPDDKRIKKLIKIDDFKNTVIGHKVRVKITEYNKQYLKGEIVDIIGHKDDPGVDIMSLVYKYDVRSTFDDLVMKEVDEIPSEVNDSDLDGRVDLTNDLIITIDGDSSKDFDDAVSLKRLSNNNFLLGVHIADVSYYVKEGSRLDEEAYLRGTSNYLIDRVIPMLPHTLSNGICSLNEGVVRLTITCEMEINLLGEVVDYKIYPSYIKSAHRMTYNNVNRMLNGEKEVIDKYQDIIGMINEMDELREILRLRRLKRGAIEFDDSEVYIDVDENCHPTNVSLRQRYNAERLIEEFMLVANETVAEAICHMELPFIYRIHEKPDKKRLQSVFVILKNLGYKFKFNLNNVYSSDIANVLNKIKGKPEEMALNTLLLRSMAKARYSDECIGHYGLAAKYYTHFTSPIRRYPDLIVHRMLRRYLFEQNIDILDYIPLQSRMIDIAAQSSKCERTAVDLEREVTDMKVAEYMQDHIDEVFDGVISSVTSYGFYVELKNGVEGLVALSNLRGYYIFDERNMALYSEIGNKSFKIGDKIRVKCIAASKEDGTVDFMPVRK